VLTIALPKTEDVQAIARKISITSK